MKASELAVIMAELSNEIDIIVDVVLKKLEMYYESDSTDNEAVTLGMDRHLSMANYIVHSMLNSRFKKEFDTSKKELDKLSDDPDGVAGHTKQIYSSNSFSFSKKQNKDGETTLIVDLVTALARAGVDKDMVDAALKSAKKPKRGNTYYQVTTLEE